jgi:hypothetical protein
MATYEENARIVRERKLQEAERKGRASTQELVSKIEVGLNTVTIGAISDFEKNFGYLWGHGEKLPLTDSQKEFRKIWESTRSSILERLDSATNKANYHVSRFNINMKEGGR